jgi:hypothetical protein
MTRQQPSEPSSTPQLELQKQAYQAPTLEQHQFLKVTGVSIPIGTISNPFDEMGSL